MGDNASAAVAEPEPIADVIEAKEDSRPAEPVEPVEPAASILPTKPFSWLDPHPIFVILIVGAEEKPFGIQKDFLCAKSRYFQDYFYKSTPNGTAPNVSDNGTVDKEVENVIRMNDISVEAFSYAQHFMYTGNVVPDQATVISSHFSTGKEEPGIPSYDLLVSIWKLGHRLGIDGLCERSLEAMAETKRLTQSIPATNILVQVWKDTPDGSSIRHLLLSWAAEYLRSSESGRSEFARALPQELLSELVVAMSSSYGDFWGLPGDTNGDDDVASAAASTRSAENGHVNGKHYLEDDYDDSTQDGGDPGANGNSSIHYRGSPPASKRARYFDSFPVGRASSVMNPATPNLPASPANIAPGSTGRKAIRTALPTGGGATPRAIPKKRSINVDVNSFTEAQKLEFCADLVTRMLSGPGFWTRLVGPFKEPVDPTSEGIPDYFTKVKRPMDLGTIKNNLDNHRYKAPEEFLADMRQIFSNVYSYWTKDDPIWTTCERLEKTFEEKYSQMSKWLVKREDEVLA
ncbi:TFIID associated protein [Sporothrix schenckii 1099-18]|uniref:Bromo domain-containing protein n=2 Tax=Sporothrix schenckii TaxID=29908 RepID=U7Q6E9_SPOS1|nr:TFIID associated protein [Sporothrix schenckii 1099-18]ERT02605.1 hypothetical protein HMPREF1624_00906 [Sporothrix schenckii ATCC 58251]KJR80099.1 TFIID associated protein [Sporothrix schenckii 1099-18]